MDDLISRQAVIEIQAKYAEHMGATKFWQMRDDIKALPAITPQKMDGGEGMILDKAIKHYKEKAEVYERQIRDEVWEPDSLSEHNCIKNAEKHRQLAEWLKELKQLREQTNVLDKIRAEIIQMSTISSNANDIYKADVLSIIDKYMVESEDKE